METQLSVNVLDVHTHTQSIKHTHILCASLRTACIQSWLVCVRVFVNFTSCAGVCFLGVLSCVCACVRVCINYLHILNLDLSACSISWYYFNNVCGQNCSGIIILPRSFFLRGLDWWIPLPPSPHCHIRLTINEYRSYWLAQPVTMATPAHRQTPAPPPPRRLFPPPPSPSFPFFHH